ncbi:MAG: hypothetical protein PHE49_09505 [bacterium]|nr:hypothetical protein [bacterium]
MSKLNQILVSVSLITVVVLGILLSGFWIYQTKQTNDRMVFKDIFNLCSDTFSNNQTFLICKKKIETFYLYLNPFQVLRARKKVDRERKYWECYNVGHNSERCSKEADEYFKTL